ncbi:class II aldolase/adducin family protein [Candidatus Cloacimonadota bacterium]
METQYQGVKFQLVELDKMKHQDARISEIIKWAKIYHEKGLAPLYETGSYGNLSFRIESNKTPFFITASNTALNSELNSDNFIQVMDCDLGNNVVYISGAGEPSSETMLHYAIYQARSDINCIMHGHCEMILQVSEQIQLPKTYKPASYGTTDLVREVTNIVNEADFLIMRDHGFLSMGNTIEAAGQLSLKILYKCST